MRWEGRYSALSIVLLAYMLCYMDRMVMASAVPFIAREFQLSSIGIGAILSAFFLGYALMQIPGGALADRFGPTIVLTASVIWFSALTACTGFCTGAATLLFVRTLFGVGEGPFPAAASKLVADWFPEAEVGKASGVLLGSTYVGATIAPLFVAAVVLNWGWRATFFALCFPGFILSGAIWLYFQRRPISDRRVRGACDESSEDSVAPRRGTLVACLREAPVLWCAATLFLANTVAWGLMNWLPTYLLNARGFSVEKMGLFTALTNLAGVVGFALGGYLCDGRFKGRLRTQIILGLLVSAVFTYLAAIAPTGQWAVGALVLVFLTANIAFTAIFTLPLLIVPRHAVGTAFGIVNTAGQAAGILAPLMVGYILQVTGGDFHTVLYWMVGLALVATYPASRIQWSPIPVERPASVP